jgi:hypothetical protein
MVDSLERIATGIESIAKSLERIANPGISLIDMQAQQTSGHFPGDVT